MTKASQQYRLIILACGASLACAAPTMAAMVELQADLKASNEVPPNESTGTGSVTATFDTDSNKLSWKGAVSGLSGQVTAAHFMPQRPGETERWRLRSLESTKAPLKDQLHSPTLKPKI